LGDDAVEAEIFLKFNQATVRRVVSVEERKIERSGIKP
jgi:hypothetical protein